MSLVRLQIEPALALQGNLADHDLPSEDPEEPGLPDEYHLFATSTPQPTFHLRITPCDQVFMAGDLSLLFTLSDTPTGLLSLMCLGSMSAHGWLRMASSQRLMAPSS